MNRLLRIRTGRQGHELFVVIATALLGVAGTISPEAVAISAASVLPFPWAVVYWAAMIICSLITLRGIFDKRIDGLLTERAGLILLTVLFGVYAYTCLEYAGLGGLGSATLPMAFALANIYRCRQIGQDLILIQAYLKDHPEEQVR